MSLGRMLVCACLGAACVVGVAGCGKGHGGRTAADDSIVAAVDGHEIRASDFLVEYATVPDDRRAYYAEHRDELLGFIINRHLLVVEARAAGLESDPAVIRCLNEARAFAQTQHLEHAEEAAALRQVEEQVLIAFMRGRVLAEIAATISEEELRALVAETSGGDLPNEFIELYAVANADRAVVETARGELLAGKEFGEVHMTYSTDKNQHLGTYSDTTLDAMPEVLRTAVTNVENGGATEVFELDGRFLVVCVVRRPAMIDLEPWRRQLLKGRQDQLLLRWVTERRAAHRIVVNTKALEAVELPEPVARPPR